MTPIGLSRDEKHVYYAAYPGEKERTLPSVTSIIGVVDKSGPLVGWAKRITAEAAVKHRAELPGWVDSFGDDGAVGMLTKASNVIRDKAANTGSDVHQYAEAIARGDDVTVPLELVPYVESYRAFLAAFEPEFLALEEMVCSLTHGYAGTFDAIARIHGETWLLDIKTSKGVYEETGLQLAAYAGADFIGRPNDLEQYAIPAIDQYGVIHLRPEGHELIPFDVTRSTFEAFLNAKALHGWKATAKAIVQQPVLPALLAFQAPAKEAVA